MGDVLKSVVFVVVVVVVARVLVSHPCLLGLFRSSDVVLDFESGGSCLVRPLHNVTSRFVPPQNSQGTQAKISYNQQWPIITKRSVREHHNQQDTDLLSK